MKLLFFLSIITITLSSCKTKNIAEVSEKSCDCFNSIKFDGDTLKFQMAEQFCINKLYNEALSLQSTYPGKTNIELLKLIQSELKEKCNSWNEVMTLYNQMNVHSYNTRINNKLECEIMKSGKFKDLTDKNVYFTIQDCIQITENLDLGTYTKSKIIWLDSCTYQLLPFESTDSIIKRHLSEKPIFNFKIIQINKDTIIYQNEYKGDFSLGEFIKMK